MSERSFRSHDVDLDTPTVVTRSAAPGRATLTSRHVMRKSRDDNGVAPDADAHVERAAGSSGAPLPADLRGRFESSLGTDLSSVRIHTGDSSAAANDAVGARAYALGQDIHFGAGQYDPTSSEGQFLIAHEVAHTVQQRGGATALQHKLTVSTVDDPAEREADRAAMQMTEGRPMTLASGLAGVVQRHRPKNSEMVDGVFPIAGDEAYNQGPYDWSGNVDNGLPLDPQPVSIPLGMAPKFKGIEDIEEHDYNEANRCFPAGMVEKRRRTFGAIRAAADQLTGSWNAMAPLASGYEHAAEELEDGGLLGPAPTGQNWDTDVGDASSMDEVSEAQHVGDNTRVGDLFAQDSKGNEKLTGVDQDALKAGTKADKKATSQASEDARLADGKVKTAVEAYNTHITNKMGAAANGITSALLDVKIEKGEKDVERAEESQESILAAREKTNAEVKAVIDSLKFVVKTVHVDSGDAADFGSVIAEAIVNGAYRQDLNNARQRLVSAKAHVSALKSQSLAVAFDTALKAYDDAAAELPGKERDIQEALMTRKRAYDTAATAAGEKAGGGAKGERIAAAMRAIPIAETVLGRVESVLTSISPPSYSEDAGIGLNAVLKQGNAAAGKEFISHIAMLRGFQSKYQGLQKKWKQRLVDLRAVSKALNVPGT